MTAAGLSLLSIGAIAILVEAHYPTLGALGAPGVLLLVAGSVLAVAGMGGGIALAVITALVLGLTGAGTVLVSVRKGMAVRRRRIRTGSEGLIGHIGVVRSWIESNGSVLVDGALWRARRSASEDTDGDLQAGDAVVVEHLSGLTLSVRRAEEWELTP